MSSSIIPYISIEYFIFRPFRKSFRIFITLLSKGMCRFKKNIVKQPWQVIFRFVDWCRHVAARLRLQTTNNTRERSKHTGIHAHTRHDTQTKWHPIYSSKQWQACQQRYIDDIPYRHENVHDMVQQLICHISPVVFFLSYNNTYTELHIRTHMHTLNILYRTHIHIR